MIRINLLPPHLRPIKRSPLPHMASIAVLAVVILTLATLYLGKQKEISDLNAELESNKQKLSKLQDVVDEFQRLEKIKAGLNETIATINEIVQDRMIWSRQLWNLNRLAQENLWYSGFQNTIEQIRETRVEYDAKTKTWKPVQVTIKHPVLKVSGYIINTPDMRDDLGPFAQRLEEDEEFSSVFELHKPEIGIAEVDGTPVKSFVLTFKIKSARSVE